MYKFIFFCFCLCLCKNPDGWLQLLRRFVGQQYNAVGIRWNPCFVGMKSLDICQFVGGKKCNNDTKCQFLHNVDINHGVFYHSAIKCRVGCSSLALLLLKRHAICAAEKYNILDSGQSF